jgi:AAA+ ATPase superfamily predicted ATPase
MRNIIGSPAEGDDFFNRPKILTKLRRELDNLSNILLVAPRRVGKTSLVLRLCEEWRMDPKRKAVFLNVEGRGDELAFAEKLIGELATAKLHPELLTRVQGVFTKLRQLIGGKGIKVPGIEMSLGEAADVEHSTLAKVLESIFRKIEDGEQLVLIAIDELPEFLLTLQKAEDGPRRVTAFLHWLRELRQTYRKNIRWVFLGSIGLDNFVEDQKLQKLINDLQVFPLDAFSPEEADAFLRALGESNGLALVDSERAEIVRLLGWPLAYHLHLVFHELRELESRSIPAAFASLLQPQKLSYFDTWHERLDVQFSTPDTIACKAILGALCKHPDGRAREDLLAVLMAKPTAEVEKVEEQLGRLLIVLQRDGYLLESSGRYTFRSFLLREYWHRRHAR